MISPIFSINDNSLYQGDCITLLKSNDIPTSDLVIADQPYAGTKGMYHGGIDLNQLWDYLRKVKFGYALSFDGKIENGDDFTYSVPSDIYTSHEYLKNGNSSFRRVIGKNNHAEVLESLYMKD